MNWAKASFCFNRYRNHQKLVIYRHFVVYFINTTKHIEDIEPDIRKSMIVDNCEPDIVFIVNDWKFPAHKEILKISNEQFYVQHIEPYQNMPEIEVKDVDPRGFQQFLRFCQFGDLNLNPLNMMPTYDVAQIYNHPRLVNICENFICNNLDTVNVLDIMNWNLFHNNYRIQNLCRGIFIENAIEILKMSENFVKIDKKLLKKILSCEVLNCSEKFLFEKTLEWADAKCLENQIEPTKENKKNILEDIWYLIRLEISPDLEVLNDFPTNPRKNRFYKRKFDNIFIQDVIEETWEEFPPEIEDKFCFGFSIILSNPETRAENIEEFLMTIESENDLVLQKHFSIKAFEFLAIKDFVFETPIMLKKDKRHILRVKFMESSKSRYLAKDDTCSARILRIYD